MIESLLPQLEMGNRSRKLLEMGRISGQVKAAKGYRSIDSFGRWKNCDRIVGKNFNPLI